MRATQTHAMAHAPWDHAPTNPVVPVCATCAPQAATALCVAQGLLCLPTLPNASREHAPYRPHEPGCCLLAG